MNQNLDLLRTEILEHVAARGLVLFPTISRVPDGVPAAFWDTENFPDFHDFIAAAETAGAKVVLLETRQLTADELDDALDRLPESDIPRDDQRSMERKLRELKAYTGFTCVLSLSFDLPDRIYIFELRTDWYEDLEGILDEIDVTSGDDEDSPIGGGYFSQN